MKPLNKPSSENSDNTVDLMIIFTDGKSRYPSIISQDLLIDLGGKIWFLVNYRTVVIIYKGIIGLNKYSI